MNINHCTYPAYFVLVYLPELRSRGLFAILKAKLRNIDIASTLFVDEGHFAKYIRTSRESVA